MINERLMTCQSPVITGFPNPTDIDPEKPKLLNYGFLMDDVRTGPVLFMQYLRRKNSRRKRCHLTL